MVKNRFYWFCRPNRCMTVRPRNEWNSYHSVIAHIVGRCDWSLQWLHCVISRSVRAYQSVLELFFTSNVGLSTAVWFTSVSPSTLSVCSFYFDYSQDENRVPRKLVRNCPSCMHLGKSGVNCFTTQSRNCRRNYYRLASSVIEHFRDGNVVSTLFTCLFCTILVYGLVI